MIVFSMLEILAGICLAIFLGSQILRPMLRGTKLFPMFSKRAKLSDEMIGLREEEELIDLEKQVEAKKKDMNRLRVVREAELDETKKGA